MATVMNSSTGFTNTRTMIQKVCIGLGIFFVVAGLGGIIMPGMLGMHLSLAHNIIHLASGALALWVGYSDVPRRAYNFAVAFGVVYGLLGIAGFVMGSPGYPGVGHMEADQNLLRVIPNVLEFGSMDHGVHVLLGAVFLISAYAYKRSTVTAGRNVTVDISKGAYGRTSTSSDVFRTTDTNTTTSLRDTELGRSDINRPVDQGRRTDFENRI